MKRIRTLGIAAVMALVLSAIAGAGVASASEFQSPGAGAAAITTWNGERTGSNHKFVLGPDQYSADNFSCSTVPFSGQMTGPSAPDITVAPSFNECTWNGSPYFPANWTMNGCKFRLRPGAGNESQTVGKLDIVGCEKPMTFTNSGCSIEIGNQNHVGTLTYKNTETEKVKTVELTASLSGILYTRNGICVGGGSGTFSNGSYTGTWIVKGTREGGKVPVKVSGTAAPAAQFLTQVSPATVTGGVDGANNKIFMFPKGAGLQCNKRSWSTEVAGGEVPDLTATPNLSECIAFGRTEAEGTSVSMGGCSLNYTSAGKFAIVGATCASNPITLSSTYPGQECSVTVGPQGPLSGLSLKNEGSGMTRYVNISAVPVKGLVYTTAGPNCTGGVGTFSDGEYKMYGSIKATDSKGNSRGIWIE